MTLFVKKINSIHSQSFRQSTLSWMLLERTILSYQQNIVIAGNQNILFVKLNIIHSQYKENSVLICGHISDRN
jgi:hypothetical protein